VTYQQRTRQRRGLLISAVAAAVALIVLFFSLNAAFAVARAQGAASVRAAVVAAAVQCCAVEGSYPSSLSHLEHDYGLTLNHADYVVEYEWLGDNVPPTVVVRAR
jgi:hypothetical protein